MVNDLCSMASGFSHDLRTHSCVSIFPVSMMAGLATALSRTFATISSSLSRVEWRSSLEVCWFIWLLLSCRILASVPEGSRWNGVSRGKSVDVSKAVLCRQQTNRVAFRQPYQPPDATESRALWKANGNQPHQHRH